MARITGHDIAVAMKEVDELRHPAEQLQWFDAQDLENVKIDGNINLIEVAALLNEKIASTRK